MKLRLVFPRDQVVVELTDTPTARAIAAAAPFESRAQTWGEEVYFTTRVRAKLEKDAKQVVEPGTVCFWTEGNALGTMKDFSLLEDVKSGDKVRVENA